MREEAVGSAGPSVLRPDVAILGAGINGAALARELVLNGVSVTVIDAADVASGTTRWSTRLVHGGLRYLEYGEMSLVRESLVERERLVRLAPHLVEPLGFYVPLRGRLGGLWAAAARLVGLERLARRWRGDRGRGAWAVGCGLCLYDLLAVGSGWPRHRVVRAGGEGLPRVDARRYPLAALYADARMWRPERFTVELLVDARRVAAAAGKPFAVLTRRAVRLTDAGLLALSAADRGAGDEGDVVVVPRAVVNATGAWVDRTNRHLLPDRSPAKAPLVGGTKGSHLIIDHAPLRTALGARGVYAEAPDGRPVFVLPFEDGLILVGTTDLPHPGDPATARADDAEIEYLLSCVAMLFPDAAPRRRDVVQHYSGVRPLPAATSAAAPGGITRRHMLVRLEGTPLPAWAIVGGKLTTCRSLAERAAREVLGALGMPVVADSRDRPLPGACGPRRKEGIVAALVAAATEAGIDVATAARSAEAAVGLFGERASAMLRAGGEAMPVAALLRPLAGGDLPVAAVHVAVAEEWAMTLEDVVERRLVLALGSRLSFTLLRSVADVLVGLGRLRPDEAAAEVDALVARLRERHGLHVVDDRH